MMEAAASGIRQAFLAGPFVAVAYLCAAIIDAVSRSEKVEDAHQGQVAAKCALAAMALSGATDEEAIATVDELVMMHRTSAEMLEQTVMAKSD